MDLENINYDNAAYKKFNYDNAVDKLVINRLILVIILEVAEYFSLKLCVKL